jgi:hypothetical protein
MPTYQSIGVADNGLTSPPPPKAELILVSSHAVTKVRSLFAMWDQ